MTSTRQIKLPNEKFRLEEINMPENLASVLAGRIVDVEVLPEVLPFTRRLDLRSGPERLPILIDKDGVAWNDHWPMRVVYKDPDGRLWRLPRHWMSAGVSPIIEASKYEVTHESRRLESFFPPTIRDLWDANMLEMPGTEALRGAWEIEVSVSPGEVPKVLWRGPCGNLWRIPHDWRRRRIKLPDCEGLLRNNLPQDIAEEFGGRIVSVNYHPGSLCCLAEGYRVRDGCGGRWPVRTTDCVVVGFGDEIESRA